jgi:hypothetical protein
MRTMARSRQWACNMVINCASAASRGGFRAAGPDLGERWPSRLVATAAENSPSVMMPAAKSIGWAIYAVGFVIWLFGYLSVGHAPAFDWVAATPWWISTFVPNLEAELGLALMFASMVPIWWRRRQKIA